jgi:hypothetical protein
VGQCTYHAAAIALLYAMTLIAPRPDRTAAPHAFATPVVRELPSLPSAAGAASSAW